MAQQIQQVGHPWLVTYDDVPAICEFYSEIPSTKYTLTYTANTKRAKGSEVMFYKGIELSGYIQKMKHPYFSRYKISDLQQ